MSPRSYFCGMNDTATLSSPTATNAPYRTAPGPKGRLVFGSLPEMRKDPLSFFIDLGRDYGDIVQIKLVQDVFLLNHPDHIKHVLQDNHLNYQKGFGYSRMEPLVGKGLLTSEGDFWKRQRRLAQPAFHRQRISGFAELMARHTAQLLDGWADLAPGAEVDAHTEMMRLTFSIVGDALFSIDLSQEAASTGEALKTALEIINDRFNQFWVTPKSIPTPENLRLYDSISRLEKVVNEIIATRRAQAARGEAPTHHDLLAMFMEMQDADTGEMMNDRQLRDEVMTMVLAGHETTANALAFTWHLLSTHPEVERRLHDEVTRVLNGRTPTMGDLPKLEYTGRVIQEAMRLYPPAWFIARKAVADDVIDGVRIPAGTSLCLVPYLAHRDPRFWDNPEGFDPERFLPDAVAARPRLAYFPFAAGPRMCIGSSFAMMEMQLIVAMVAQRFQLQLRPGARLELDPQVTLRPRHGVPVTLRARQAEAA